MRLSFLWLTLGSLASGQDIQFRLIDPVVVEQRFLRVQPKNDQRAATLRQIFAEAGCGPERWTEPPVKGSKLPNLICTLPGSSSRTVVVSAHYDKVNAGQGAIDNWSGASLLPSFYEALNAQARNLTFTFVLMSDEEKGLVGSSDFVRKLTPAQRQSIVALVNVDSVGLAGATKVWASRAAPKLLNATARVATALKLPVEPMNIDKVGDSDSHPFANEKIPVIDFHSLTTETLPLLHSSKDVPAAVDQASYYQTFQIVTGLLAFLDATEAP